MAGGYGDDGCARHSAARGSLGYLTAGQCGLLIWFSGVIAAMFAEARHWPAGQISQIQAVEIRCKFAGFTVLLVAGLASFVRSRLVARARRGAGTGRQADVS